MSGNPFQIDPMKDARPACKGDSTPTADPNRSALLLSLAMPVVLTGSLLASFSAVWAGEVFPRLDHDSDIGISFGFGFGVVSLAAFWTSLGPLKLFTRGPLAVLLTILAACVMATFIFMKERSSGELAIVLVLAAAVAAQWTGLAAALMVLRAWLRFRIDLPGQARPSDNRAVQFGIRQMLIWTTGVAITLGVVRLLVARWGPEGFDTSNVTQLVIVFSLILAFNLAVALLWLIALLARRWMGLLLIAAGLGTVVFTLIEYPTFCLVLGRPPGGDNGIFWWLNGCGSLCLALNLLVVRLCGYRIVREVS